MGLLTHCRVILQPNMLSATQELVRVKRMHPVSFLFVACNERIISICILWFCVQRKRNRNFFVRYCSDYQRIHYQSTH